MDARSWIAAHEAGKIVHNWAPIEIGHGGRTARLMVSADAAKVTTTAGDIRESAGAYALEQLAQCLGGHMLTAKLMEIRHTRADVMIDPLVSSLVKAGGTVSNTTAAEHSEAIDREVTALGLRPASGPLFVANVGKLFVLDSKCTETRCVNHGWLVKSTTVSWRSGQATWKGIPVSACSFLDGWHLIQNRGAAHGFGPRGKDQDDYSQTALVVDGMAWVSGIGEIETAKLYTEPELAGFVVHDEQPLPWAHHPGVPLAVGAGTDDGPEDTVPTSVVSWQNHQLTHGERCIEWMLAQMSAGIREVPMGSNNGPEVGEWLGACERDGQPGFGIWLKKTGGSWCAAAACAADVAARMTGDPESPYKSRASGIEIENDAKAAGAWRKAELAERGTFSPERGDVVILPRGKPGGWQRHVCRFVRWIDFDQGTIETIGGNEGNRFRLTARHVSEALGFVEMPSPLRPIIMIALPADEIRAMPMLLADASAGNPWEDGDNLIA